MIIGLNHTEIISGSDTKKCRQTKRENYGIRKAKKGRYKKYSSDHFIHFVKTASSAYSFSRKML